MRDKLPQNNVKTEAILVTLSSIPCGKVSSYGDIAKRSGFPGHARFVAKVLKDLPQHSAIPWHRVINSQGKISFPPESKMYLLQHIKLKKEGVIFSASGKVSRQFFW